MDFVNIPLLAASALVFASVLTGLYSTRIGFSFLLVFLLTGILAGEDGLGGWRFDDFVLSFWVGNLALAVILLDGGLRTAYATFRTGLKPASLLATVGVVVTMAITALAGMLFVGLDLGTALLLGAIVGSTDAAAVFALLTRSGVTLNERVAATLEIESGVNDPMAVYLTLSMIALLSPSSRDVVSTLSTLGTGFFEQFGYGAVFGAVTGFGAAVLLKRLRARSADGVVVALLVVSAGLATFAAAGLVGGSGFLAVYLFGLIVGNRAAGAVAPTLPAIDGYAWLSQAGMFLLLGLLVTPSQTVESLWPGIGVAATLILVARPAAVWLCLAPFRFSAREIWFIAWVGLRGAVPIVLALFPLMAATPNARLLFDIAFIVVLASLLTQGSTIGLVARRLNVAMPDPTNEQAVRAVFRDFAIEPATPVGAVCDFYGLPAPDDRERPVAAWIAAELKRPPVAGDTVQVGPAVLVVREVDGGRITAVGIGLGEG